jgi:hypothetical protein
MTPINLVWQGKLQGTKWQYYSLMNVQTAFVDGSNNPTLLSNTQMETYFQQASSCITCHSLASIGPTRQLRLNFFYPLNPYVGAVDFQTVANQQFPGMTFKPMDFVWSMRNAQYKAIPAPAKK